MSTPVNPNTVLVVPVHIAVLRVGKDAPEMMAARANFSKLPYHSDDWESVKQKSPFTSDTVLQEESAPPTQGIHLHWTLPEALRTLKRSSDQDEKANNKAVPVPNRWRVTRTIHTHTTSNSRSRSWVVESDRLNKKDPNRGIWPPTVTVPVHPDDFSEFEEGFGYLQNYRYLGQVFQSEKWEKQQQNPETVDEYLCQPKPPSLSRKTLPKKWNRLRRTTPKTEAQSLTTPYDLTIFGYGDPDFTGLYPNCCSVFGFCDTVKQLQQDGYNPKTDKLSYSVVGWYSDDNKDPVNQREFNFVPPYKSSVFQLNGNRGYIEVPGHSNPTQAITVAIWAKSDTKTWNASSCLISKRDAFIFHPVAGGKELRFYVYVNGWNWVSFTPDIDITEWHHYAATFDGSNLILYIDGQECKRTSVKGTIARDSGALFIGKDDGSNEYFQGKLAHVCIWDKALDQEKIQSYKDYPLKGDEPNLLGYYPLNEIVIDLNQPTAKNLVDPYQGTGALPNGIARDCVTVISNSLPVTSKILVDDEQFQDYLNSGLQLEDQETGCYNLELEWFFKSATLVQPAASLYRGIVEAFDYDLDKTYSIPKDVKEAKHQIVVGNTRSEALSALMASRLEGYSDAEQMLNALQMNILSDLNKVGGAISVERQLHSARFSPAVKTKTWEIVAKKGLDAARNETNSSETLPQLPMQLVEQVNNLNFLEFQFTQLQLQLAGMQRQLMADWRKYLYVKYTETNHIPIGSVPRTWIEQTGGRDSIFKTLENILDILAETCGGLKDEKENKELEINRLKEDIEVALAHTVVSGEKKMNKMLDYLDYYYELSSSSTDTSTYYQANEPCILLSGAGVKPPEHYGKLSNRDDGFVECSIDLPGNFPNTSPYLPSNTVVLNASSFNKQASEILVQYIQALEKQACLVATGQRSKNTVSSPLITVTSASSIDTWLPLMMEWMTTVRPLQLLKSTANTPYDPKIITSKFNFKVADVDFKENPSVLSAQRQMFTAKNMIQLSAGVTVSLQYQIDLLLENLDENDPFNQALENLREELSKMNLLSQTLAGFNNACLMRQQTMQLAVWDPLAVDEDDFERLLNVQKAVGDEAYLGEIGSGSFNPLRGGIMQVGISVIDCFGRKLQLNQGTNPKDFIVAKSLQPVDENLQTTRYIKLPPRIVPPSQLIFKWLSSEGEAFVNDNDVNPILGWIIYNYLEDSLDIYDTNGLSLGSIFVVEQNGRPQVHWQGQPGSPNWLQPPQIENKVLDKIVMMILKEGVAYLQAFFRMLNNATQLSPSQAGSTQNISIFLGKPLALVSAYVQFDCNGNSFPLSQGWSEIKALSEPSAASSDMLKARKGQVLSSIEIPLRLGQENSVEDGLVGFFKHDKTELGGDELDTSYFFSESASSNVAHDNIVKPAIDSLVLSTEPEHYELVTMLVDPFKKIHITSGLLPGQSIQVSPRYLSQALENMKSTFLVSPIVGPSTFIDVNANPALPLDSSVVPKLPMLTPNVALSNGQWSWLEPSQNSPASWEELEPTDLTCEVGVNYSPQIIREGWLLLSHSSANQRLPQSYSRTARLRLPTPIVPSEVILPTDSDLNNTNP